MKRQRLYRPPSPHTLRAQRSREWHLTKEQLYGSGDPFPLGCHYTEDEIRSEVIRDQYRRRRARANIRRRFPYAEALRLKEELQQERYNAAAIKEEERRQRQGLEALALGYHRSAVRRARAQAALRESYWVANRQLTVMRTTAAAIALAYLVATSQEHYLPQRESSIRQETPLYVENPLLGGKNRQI